MLTNLVRLVSAYACAARKLLRPLTSFRRRCIRECLVGERRSLQSRAPACASCVFVTAFAGARGRVAARRIGLCLGFLAAAAAASRWVWTLLLFVVIVCGFDFVQVPHLDLAILNHMSRGGAPSLRLCRADRDEPPDETLRGVTVDRYDDTASVDLTVWLD